MLDVRQANHIADTQQRASDKVRRLSQQQAAAAQQEYNWIHEFTIS